MDAVTVAPLELISVIIIGKATCICLVKLSIVDFAKLKTLKYSEAERDITSADITKKLISIRLLSLVFTFIASSTEENMHIAQMAQICGKKPFIFVKTSPIIREKTSSVDKFSSPLTNFFITSRISVFSNIVILPNSFSNSSKSKPMIISSIAEDSLSSPSS